MTENTASHAIQDFMYRVANANKFQSYAKELIKLQVHVLIAIRDILLSQDNACQVVKSKIKIQIVKNTHLMMKIDVKNVLQDIISMKKRIDVLQFPIYVKITIQKLVYVLNVIKDMD